MTPDLSHLETLAKAATPGPWIWNSHYECVHTHSPLVNLRPICRQPNNHAHEPTMAYIAAANPATVLAIIRELRAARYVVDRMRYVQGAVTWVAPEIYPLHMREKWMPCMDDALATYDAAISATDDTEKEAKP